MRLAPRAGRCARQLALVLALLATLIPAAKAQAQATPLCRLGLSVFWAPVANFNVQPLRLGWYRDDYARAIGMRPNGIEYIPSIRLRSTGEGGYSFHPNGAELDAVIAAHPGAYWLIGNEPDRRYFQDDVLPAVYAHAYHDVSGYILARDPTARLLPGSIVQATPLRLQYLDLVLAAYRDAYGVDLPAEGWSLHNFILNEQSCTVYPDTCWGADIPPGIDADQGMVITDLDDHVSIALFSQQIERFRRWMADNGYRNTPLFLTEYGVLMPEYLGFPPARVNQFMTETFDYLLTASDAAIGYPADGNRLVQRYAWFSAVDAFYNGSLFVSTAGGDPYVPPFVRTAMGDHFAAYAAGLTAAPDLAIVAFDAAPLAGAGVVSATLTAQVANLGHGQLPTAATVQFYAGDPATGGVALGAAQPVALAGCGATTTVATIWADIDPAGGPARQVFAVVTAAGDSQPANDSLAAWVVLGEHRTFAPLLSRP